MPHADTHIALIITTGILLGTALLGGLVGNILRLPHVTSYLLVGLLLGPHTLGIIPNDHLGHLHPLGELAMALVLFNMGCHFTLVHLRRILRRVLRLSMGELVLTFVLVGVGLWVIGERWQIAILFASLALATAPATTILVLKENESEGPVTEYATALVALNNLASILIFELIFLAIVFASQSADVGWLAEIGLLGRDLIGSMALGGAAGLAASFACSMLSRSKWLVLLIAISTLVLGACATFQLQYLLAFLTMGITVANASDRTADIEAELDRVTGLLCVVFFVIHGAELDLRALVNSGIIGAAYIVLRSAGKYGGIRLAASKAREDTQIRRWLGATMLSQAGAAIALAEIASRRDPALGTYIMNIVLGTVAFFEIAGPLLIRQAVIRSGEVPLSQASGHTSTTPWEEFRLLVNRVRTAMGYDPWRGRKPEQLQVSDLMRRNVKGIPAMAQFTDVVDFIHHSHDNLFPVLEKDDVLVGVIRYEDLRDVLFDPMLQSLVCAADLARPHYRDVYPDQPISTAWNKFRHAEQEDLLVVTRELPHRLMGIVKRRDVFRLLSRSNDGIAGNFPEEQAHD